MRFVLDQNMPPGAAAWFIRRGFDAMHVADRSMASADDEAVASLARAEDRIVVTKDRDFERRDDVRVVLITPGNLTNARLLVAWEACWPATEAALRRGEGLVVVRTVREG